MDDTRIEWADDTANPWWGCVKVSPACQNCYAEGVAERFHGDGLWGPNGDRRLRLDAFARDLERIARRGEREGRPRRVFIASMSDVFEDRADLIEPRARVWDILHRLGRRIVPMLLTKRPAIMAAWAKSHGWPDGAWAGTTVEDQQRADERVPELLRVPAVLFLSMEPLLGPVDLGPLWPFHWSWPVGKTLAEAKADGSARLNPQRLVLQGTRRIDWIIVGGESGPWARPMHPAWARSLRDQAAAAGVPFFFKQWGEWAPVGRTGSWNNDEDLPGRKHAWVCLGPGAWPFEGAHRMARVGKHAAGRLLDGRTWDELPVVGGAA